jgi:signal peptidase I
MVGVVITVLMATCSNASKPFQVRSHSMSPTYNPGDAVITKPFDSRLHSLGRFDIVVFRPPFDAHSRFAFRVVGLPNETITFHTNGLQVDGLIMDEATLPKPLRAGIWIPHSTSGIETHWELGPHEIFVVGDNLSNAYDSRYWGPLPITNVMGLVRSGRETNNYLERKP